MKKVLLCLISLLFPLSPLVARQGPFPPPAYLYKVVSPSQWEKSQAAKEVIPSPIDKEFIHLATEEQLPYVIQKFWNNKEHFILKLDTNKLQGRLVCEPNRSGGDKFYHLYDGKIPLDAVVQTSEKV